MFLLLIVVGPASEYDRLQSADRVVVPDTDRLPVPPPVLLVVKLPYNVIVPCIPAATVAL